MSGFLLPDDKLQIAFLAASTVLLHRLIEHFAHDNISFDCFPFAEKHRDSKSAVANRKRNACTFFSGFFVAGNRSVQRGK